MKVDVAIIGGGLAGNLLALQLRRELPSLSVAMFERKEVRSFKVGESTVEIASNYLARRLGLNGYLYRNHLPKNGLRFFFDREDRQGELEQLAEVGSEALPFHPSFQLDRRRLETDLLEFNRQAGVSVAIGAQVRRLAPGGDGSPHRLTIEYGDEVSEVEARWLVDASGRARLLQKTLGMSTTDAGHDLAAAWGRFDGVVDIDDSGSANWRARVRNTPRHLSTIHFCYPGYWIWFIPLSCGLTSVGVVSERSSFSPAMRSAAGLSAFLHGHRAVSTLLGSAQPVDVGSHGNLSYGAPRFFGTRWASIGEAAAFSDPFYSPGSDFIALENDLVTDLIRRDVTGGLVVPLAEVTELYEQYMQFRFEATMRLYRGQYSLLGSYPLLRLKVDYDIASYYLLWFNSYLNDRHLDPTAVTHELRQRDFVLTALTNFANLFKQLESSLRARNGYFEHNLDRCYCEPAHIAVEREVGPALGDKDRLRRLGALFNRVRDEARAHLHGPGEASGPAPLPLYDFLFERSLA